MLMFCLTLKSHCTYEAALLRCLRYNLVYWKTRYKCDVCAKHKPKLSATGAHFIFACLLSPSFSSLLFVSLGSHYFWSECVAKFLLHSSDINFLSACFHSCNSLHSMGTVRAIYQIKSVRWAHTWNVPDASEQLNNISFAWLWIHMKNKWNSSVAMAIEFIFIIYLSDDNHTKYVCH